MTETQHREAIARFGKSMFERGLTFGSSGNISVRLDDGWLMTPTNASLGHLDPAKITKLDDQGTVVSGDAPTKETFLHIAMYEERPRSCIYMRHTPWPSAASMALTLIMCCRRSRHITSCVSGRCR